MSAFVFDPALASDPYALWNGLEPGVRLERNIVQGGLGCWLAAQYRWIWDKQTKIRSPWYLSRLVGLCAWCWYEAGLRLSAFSSQDSFTQVEFRELHFCEQAKKRGAEAIKDPFWDELFSFKKKTGDLKFYANLPILMNQAPLEHRLAMRLFCLYWDRLCEIPLEFWTAPAVATFLATKLEQIDRHGIAPNTELVRKWRERLGLVPFKPSVVTQYLPRAGIPPTGYDHEAFQLAGIPAPLI